jgi:LysM repeat protein
MINRDYYIEENAVQKDGFSAFPPRKLDTLPLVKKADKRDFFRYRVKNNDTLYSIAQKELGEESLWSVIGDINGCQEVYEGQMIRVPKRVIRHY